MTDAAPAAVLDIDGPAAPPRSNGELVFAEPWESRAFGLAMALNAGGVFEWEDFRQHLIAAVAGAGEPFSYYRCWLLALERVLDDKGVVGGEEVLRRARELEARPAGHDHDHGHGGHGGQTTTTEPEGAPRTLSVYATWEGGYRCRVQARHHEIRIDEPLSAGGADSGPQPTEVFLASLASCYALALAHVARKRGMELADVAVRAVGEYDGPKFVKLRVEVTSSHPRDEVEPLLARAAAVCYVSNTLRAVDDVEVVVVNA